MDGAPRKIHVTSKAYLAAWTINGRLRAGEVRFGGESKVRAPAQVAWRPEWWGEDRPDLNRRCEQMCGALERTIPGVVRRVAGRPEMTRDDKALLAQIVALHILRTPGFLASFTAMRHATARSYRDRFGSDELHALFMREVGSDESIAEQLLAQLNKLATLVAAMHWTLVEFDEALLITGDHPVVIVPLAADGDRRPITATPQGFPLLDCVEIRFALGPRHALVATWNDGFDQRLGGTWSLALNLNTAVLAQAQWHWMRSPERVPALPSVLVPQRDLAVETPAGTPIGGSGRDTVLSSRRRQEARLAIDRLIDEHDDRTMSVLAVERQAAA
jgi:hypothetical protein